MMQQIKIFKTTEYRYKDLEKQVNDWITAEGVRILNIFGNIAPQTGSQDESSANQDFADSDLFLIVHYETAESR